MAQYRVDQVPRYGQGAFTPPLLENGVSFGAGLRTVVGFPGTSPIPIEPTHSLSELGYDPRTRPSMVAPNTILPTVYLAGTKNMGPFGDRTAARTAGIYAGGNPMPVPAIDPGRIPQVQQNAPSRMGGRTVIGWPQAVPQYPSVTSGQG